MYVDDKNLHQFYYKQTKMILNLGGIDIWGNVFDVGTPDDNHILNIDDCQLILKPISEMSEGDKTIFMKIPIMKKLLPCPDVMFWLIKHGYALDDAWFENGIAIKEKEEIK